MEPWYATMTRTFLSGLSAFAGLAVLGRAFDNRAPRESRRLRGFEGALLDMLRRDATNIEYMMHGLNSSATRERRRECSEAEERV